MGWVQSLPTATRMHFFREDAYPQQLSVWDQMASGCGLPYANDIRLEPCLEYKLKHHFTVNYMCLLIDTGL